MFKKIALSLALVILILGIALLLPKNIKEFPTTAKSSSFRFLNFRKDPETTIILTGDIMLGRSVMQTSLSKSDPNYPFRAVADTLQKTDLVFGNLETPVVENCPETTSGMIFCADPEMLSGLKFAGIDIVSIANNHTKNYGENGFAQTEKYLTEEGISYVGAENLVIREVKGSKFGFLSFSFVDNKPTALDYQLVRDSKSRVDVLLVMVHWGNEYNPDPTFSQKEIADNLIKTGADVVVGAHPHWVQGVDTVGGKPIFYSLGNFVFDQAWSEETKTGLAIRLTYRDNKLSKIEEMPVYMENFAQPKWTTD